MRRIFAVMLAVCLCLSLVACGKSKKAESVPAPTSVPEATSVPEPASEPADAPPQETAPNIAAADVAAAPTDGEKTLLSAPYVEMFENGDYQFTRSVVYKDEPYRMITAAKNGMFCRKLMSEDGTQSNRIVAIDGAAWQINDGTGAIKELSAEDAAAEAQPYCGADFSFVAATTLDTGYIAEAYTFDYQGIKYNIMFVLSPEGELVMLITTVNEETTSMEILEMTAPADETLFEVPET